MHDRNELWDINNFIKTTFGLWSKFSSPSKSVGLCSRIAQDQRSSVSLCVIQVTIWIRQTDQRWLNVYAVNHWQIHINARVKMRTNIAKVIIFFLLWRTITYYHDAWHAHTWLTTDASPVGLGTLLEQKQTKEALVMLWYVGFWTSPFVLTMSTIRGQNRP